MTIDKDLLEKKEYVTGALLSHSTRISDPRMFEFAQEIMEEEGLKSINISMKEGLADPEHALTEIIRGVLTEEDLKDIIETGGYDEDDWLDDLLMEWEEQTENISLVPSRVIMQIDSDLDSENEEMQAFIGEIRGLDQHCGIKFIFYSENQESVPYEFKTFSKLIN